MTEKPKKQAVQQGDVFFVPLIDGTQSIGQVVKVTKKALNSIVCAFFDIHLSVAGDQVEQDLQEGDLISVRFVTSDLLADGYWRVIENRKVKIDVESYIPVANLERNGFVGVSIVGSGNIQEFLSAYYGLCPWDAWHDPTYLDKLLVPQKKRPANVLLTKG